MTSFEERHSSRRNQEYLVDLIQDLRGQIATLAQQSPRVVTAPVTATDTVGNTFTVTMPSQQDGTLTPLAGISAPADFLPTVGDTVQLQVIGASPVYLPGRIAAGQVTTTELDPTIASGVTLAATKITTFVQSTAPTATTVGDLWIDTSNGNLLNRANATGTGGWVPLQDAQISTAITNAATAQGTANARITTFFTSSTPTALAIGDLWVDTGNGNLLKRATATGTAGWVAVQDAGILQGITTANIALIAGQNLVPDPSFENAFRTVAAPYSLETTTADIHTGTRSLKIASNASAQNFVMTTTKISVLQGHTYRISAWRLTDASYNGTATNGKLKLVKQDGTTVVASQTWTNGTTYTQVLTTYTVPSDGSVSQVQVVLGSDHTAGNLWVDDVELVDITDAQAALSAATAAQGTANTANTLAATKITVFRQPTQPVGIAVGDVWIDTDDGNQQYIWGPVGSVVRQNLAPNPSFEADTAGTVTAVTGWTNYTNGSPGTLTVSVANTGSGIALGTRCAKVVSASMPITSGAAMGFQQTYTAVPGDIFRIQAVLTVAATDTNKLPEILVEWLNASSGVIGSTTTTGSGTLTSQQTLIVNVNAGTALPALTASVRVTIRRRANGSGTALTNADLMVDTVLVEKNKPGNAQNGYFDGDTAATTFDSKWDVPGSAPNSTSTYWQDSTATANQWYPLSLRSSALEPGSIVASNVVANGTVSASLLQAVLVLATTLIAGNPAGDHTTLQGDGLHLFSNTSDGNSQQVGQLSTSANDFFSIVDSSGNIVASIASDGSINAVNLTVKNDPLIKGTPFTQWIGAASNIGAGNPLPGQTTYGTVATTGSGITSEVGLIEVPVYIDSSRWYLLGCEVSAAMTSTSGELRLRVRDGGTGTPTLTSTLIMYNQYSGQGGASYSKRYQTFGLYAGGGTTGTHRLLLSIECAASGTAAVDLVNSQSAIYLIDMGPAQATGNAQVNSGGGGTPVPKQQFFTELGPAGWASYNGSGTHRTDTTDVVQGLDPSGFNGFGDGYWWFSLPSITPAAGADRVDWYTYTNFTYFNSGGTALWNTTSATGTASPSFSKINGGDDSVGGYPKPGAKAITFPSGWYTEYDNAASPRATSVSAGPDFTGNEVFYCRFDGPSARLRIWWTQ